MKKPDVKNILVPIDFSRLSNLAIETAKILARRLDATVHLVHVHEFFYPAGFMAPGTFVPMSLNTYRDAEAKRLGQDLKTLAKRHDLLASNCRVKEGTSTFDEVCQLARDIPADLIVMSTHGYTGITHFFEGSNAERIVQHAPCPVYVVKENNKRGKSSAISVGSLRVEKILVPVDFSDCSFEGLKHAIQFADKFGARILLLNAVHLDNLYTSDGPDVYDRSRLQEAVRKGAEEQMRRIAQRAKFGRVKFETVIEIGLPVDKICAVADKNNVDLIITSTHGRTGFKHVLIGSTAEKVVRRAKQPVLVVPSHPEMRVAKLARKTQHGQRRIDLGKKPRSAISTADLAKRDQTRLAHPFPERRKTNKFRESHSS